MRRFHSNFYNFRVYSVCHAQMMLTRNIAAGPMGTAGILFGGGPLITHQLYQNTLFVSVIDICRIFHLFRLQKRKRFYL